MLANRLASRYVAGIRRMFRDCDRRGAAILPKTNVTSYVCIMALAAMLGCFALPARAAELFEASVGALTVEQQSSLDRIRSQPTTGTLRTVTINLEALGDSTTTV